MACGCETGADSGRPANADAGKCGCSSAATGKIRVVSGSTAPACSAVWISCRGRQRGAPPGRRPRGAIQLPLLAHQPCGDRRRRPNNEDLQLPGHTHGDQLWPTPYVAKLVTPTAPGPERFGDTPPERQTGDGEGGGRWLYLAQPPTFRQWWSPRRVDQCGSTARRSLRSASIMYVPDSTESPSPRVGVRPSCSTRTWGFESTDSYSRTSSGFAIGCQPLTPSYRKSPSRACR